MADGRYGSSNTDTEYGDTAWVDTAGDGSVMGRLWFDNLMGRSWVAYGSQPPADTDTAA